MVGGIDLLTRVVEDEPVDAAELDAQRLASTDHLGPDPAATVRAMAKRSVVAFSRPEALDRRYPVPVPDAPGALLANLCLLESCVHGWDVAAGAGISYRPDDAVVAAVREFSLATIGDDARRRGLFGPAVPTGAGADAFTVTLGHLGRRARAGKDDRMAYDEKLAAAVRDLIGQRPGVAEKKMFGGIAFLLGGNMAVGVHGDELIVRLSAEEAAAALAEPGTRPFDITGRPMKGWLLVGFSNQSDMDSVERWVERGFTFATGLPPK